MQRRSVEGAEGELLRMAREKEGEFKRAVRYHMDRKEFLCGGKVDRSFYSCATDQDFLNYRQNVTTESKFNVHCKLMEEIVDQPSPSLSHPSSKAHSAHSIMKREEGEGGEREDSEDCCSRAERTEFDERGNKLRYREAQEKLKAGKNARNKRSAVSKAETKIEEGVRKVRFSDKNKDRDFM
jgi:hypothetical protein